MFTYTHRWFSFQPSRPRSTLMKVFCGVVGLILLALLLVFGLVFGLAVLLFSTVRGIVRSFREKPATAAERGVIDGEYSVVSHRDDLISSR